MEVLNSELIGDEAAIRALTARFTDAVNRRSPEELGALFSEQGTWVVPGVGDTNGPVAITTLLADLLGRFSFLVQILHSGVVELGGDRATARWYLSEFAASDDGRGWRFVGVYQDRHVRTGDGWLFERRKFDFLYRGPADATGKQYPFPEIE
jgi:uncharacterized protein (TIGR02246 family)